jgi:aspartate carbamoyltransferase catalytic subunit
MTKRLKHFYESQQLDKDLIFHFFEEADKMSEKDYEDDLLKGEILATLFCEPSARTKFSPTMTSFKSAMLKLGGNVITEETIKELSSAFEAGSIEDTIMVVGKYSDCAIIKHYEEGTVKRAAEIAEIPLINAGDGRGQNPTQALTDIYTINNEIGRLENLKVILVGDLANGREVRSLSYLLAKLPQNKLTFVSPDNLKMKDDVKGYLRENKIEFEEHSDLNKILPEADVIYMTRIQKERMPSEDYERAKGKYVINESNFSLIRKDARILHPLPRVDEIQLPFHVIRYNPKVAIFNQVENGLYIRMALLKHLIGE